MPGDGRTTLEQPWSSAEAPGLARLTKALKGECDEIRRDKRRYEEIRREQFASEEMKEIQGLMRKYQEMRCTQLLVSDASTQRPRITSELHN